MRAVGRPTLVAALAVLAAAGAGSVAADPTAGVDAAAPFRAAYDANGLFSLEGARLMPRRDMSFKAIVGYAHSPIRVAVPGIGDAGKDRILDEVTTLDLAFGLTLTERFAIGFDVGAYRTATGTGYGQRGHYENGQITARSTGLVALRPLSNLDPSAPPSRTGAFLGDELAGPLDARVGAKYQLYAGAQLAIAAVASVSLPFGDEEMLLGDRNLVYEPMLAAEWRPARGSQTRILANVSARIRERTVLESFDASNAKLTATDATAYLDIGSELVAGLGGALELGPRLVAVAELSALVSLPAGLDYGTCHLYRGASCSDAVYAPGAKRGDTTALGAVGALIRLSTDVTAEAIVGGGIGGARADEIRLTTGLVWAPQPAGTGTPGRGDRDGDGIPDSIDACPDDAEDKDGFQDEDGCPDLDNDKDGIPDAKDRCPDEPEDKDGYQDEDGCPEADNDGDGIPDLADKCPNEPEDKDGYQDDDGCPDPDNDNDGFPDAIDKCPNDAETVNGFEDEDGCPDSRATAGPEERADRIDTKGSPIGFVRGAATLTPAGKQLVAQIAQLIKAHKLTIRVEVHVALGTASTAAATVRAQKVRDKALASKRAQVILDALIAAGVPAAQVQAVGLGSERPLGQAAPADPANERVDFIKAQQGAAP